MSALFLSFTVCGASWAHKHERLSFGQTFECTKGAEKVTPELFNSLLQPLRESGKALENGFWCILKLRLAQNCTTNCNLLTEVIRIL